MISAMQALAAIHPEQLDNQFRLGAALRSKVLPQLPLQWTRETLQLGKERHPAADHGVQLICPNPLPGASGRYVVLNSGHTYHDSELRFSYMVFPRLGDWAIFKTGDNPPTAPNVSETLLTSGFFDEAWGAPGGR